MINTDETMRVLLLAVGLLVACADDADPLQTDPEKRVSSEDTCQAQAEAWCVAFEFCPGNACAGIPECRPDRTTPDWLEVCVPAFAASCELGTGPVEVSRVAACLEAIEAEECSAFGLPAECVWAEASR